MSSEDAKKRKREDGGPGYDGGGEGMGKEDEKWEYSAPSIPTRHWIDQGFDEDYIEWMEIFLKSIKDYTCELRSGSCREAIVFGGGGANDPVLLHDDALLPHWEEFANALQLYQNPEASHNIAIGNIQLTSSVMKMLTPALKDKPIKGFALGNNEFGNIREGIDFAVEIIQGNPRLNVFQWANNSTESAEDANHLVEAIIGHPLIDSIGLYNCFGENVNAYDILCSLLASNKEFLWIGLRSNSIRTRGRTEIPDYLATNPPLKNLFLANNRLDDNDAEMIAQALKRNTILRSLDLGRNDITDTGRDALRCAIFDSTSLNSVAGSNHSCCIDGLELDNINDDEEEPKVNRGSKIYSILSSRNREGSNVQHLDAEFGDESFKLVPKVLEAVNIYAGYASAAAVHPLSVMYEVLRSWKMPTLYENNRA